MDELRGVLEQGVAWLAQFRHHPHRIGEQNTKASLVEPIIGALGWNIRDLDEVNREYRRRRSDTPVDYALLLLHKPRLFIEAKGFGENLDDPRWTRQTITYATMAGVEWVVLTDGAEWRVFNAHALVPVEQKLFGSVRIDQNPGEAVDLLGLLSKDSMEQDRIGERWQRLVVDRQVHSDLAKLFSGASEDLVALLDRRLPKLSADEIRASLARARVTIGFTSAPVAPATGVAPGVSRAAVVPARGPARPVAGSSTARHRDPARLRVTQEERRIRLPDMIAEGRLRPGTTLYCDYLGKRYHAELLASGMVRYDGVDYRSLSRAGAAVKVVAHGRDIPGSVLATDGMGFWSAEDSKTGDVVTIKVIRRRVAQDSANREIGPAGRTGAG